MKKNYSDRPGILSFMGLILTLVVSLYFTEKQNDNEIHKEQVLLTETTKYVCPVHPQVIQAVVHPQVIQAVPGNCPICGAVLTEAIVQYKKNNDTFLPGLIYQTSNFLAQ